MKSLKKNNQFIAKTIALVCMMLLPSACTWMKPLTYTTPPRFSNWNLTKAQVDTLNTFLKEFNRLEKENALQKSRIESRSLDIAKMRAEKENLLKLNIYLEDELKNIKGDLEYVEKQFISFERRIQSVETKASAVAAQAESKITLDKMLRENPESIDSLILVTVKSKLAQSDECLKNDQYAAAVYYAKRAQRIMELSAKMQSIYGASGDARIIAAKRANLRDGPGTHFRVVQKLQLGTPVVQLAEQGNWRKIKTEDGKEGWVHKALIK